MMLMLFIMFEQHWRVMTLCKFYAIEADPTASCLALPKMQLMHSTYELALFLQITKYSIAKLEPSLLFQQHSIHNSHFSCLPIFTLTTEHKSFERVFLSVLLSSSHKIGNSCFNQFFFVYFHCITVLFFISFVKFSVFFCACIHNFITREKYWGKQIIIAESQIQYMFRVRR